MAAQSLYAGQPFGRLFSRAIGELRLRDRDMKAAELLLRARDAMTSARAEAEAVEAAKLEAEAAQQKGQVVL